jgi:hypothetical protein
VDVSLQIVKLSEGLNAHLDPSFSWFAMRMSIGVDVTFVLVIVAFIFGGKQHPCV